MAAHEAPLSLGFARQEQKVKSQSEVAESCLTLSDSMDCGLPGFSVHGIFQEECLSGVPLYSKAVSREHKNDFGIPLEKPFVKLK